MNMPNTITRQYLAEFPPLHLDEPPHVHRLDRRPLPWLWIWGAIDAAVLMLVAVRVW